MKALIWLAGSRFEVKSFPAGIQDDIGYAFQKKSKTGIATPKSKRTLVRQRLKQLRSEVKNLEKKSS
jgi:hypothetical protein